MTDLLANLTEPQTQAVTHIDGPLLVLAGAGSGKTRVITRRAAYMVQQGVNPSQVVSITFTNKAAGEMRQRIGDLLGDHGHRMMGQFWRGEGMVVSTFHSFCVYLLRTYGTAIGVDTNFTINDDSDQRRLMREVIKNSELSTDQWSPSKVLNVISQAKNALQDVQAFSEASNWPDHQVYARLYAGYQAMLEQNKGLDFDDLLMKTVQLLQRHDDVRGQVCDRFRYVQIDEYQDTNAAQYALVRLLGQDHKNVCATGDPDQSIYGWRGARLDNILDFEKDFRNATVVYLEQNYRSTRHILRAASTLIAHNKVRKDKTLFTDNNEGDKVYVLQLDDQDDEADYVARQIESLRRRGVACRDIAVFYRVNSLMRNIEQALRTKGVPYQVSRGVSYFSRAEVKTAMAYLRVMVNPSDGVAFERAASVPKRGIGAGTMESLLRAAPQAGGDLIEVISKPEQYGIKSSTAKRVRNFAKVMNELRNIPVGESLADLVDQVISRSGLRDHYDQQGEDDAVENLDELVSWARQVEQQIDAVTLDEFLTQASLVSDVDTIDESNDAVTLTTLHGAKGLEFPVVFVVALEEGLLPHFRALEAGPDARDEMEEERRLCFVGMTRAKERLVLTYTRERLHQGQYRRQIASRFLDEIGTDSAQTLNMCNQDDDDPFERVYAQEQEHKQNAQRRKQFSFGTPPPSPSNGGGSSSSQADAESPRRHDNPMEYTDQVDPDVAMLRVGMMVWHEKFGHGRIRELRSVPLGGSAVVRFMKAGEKTIVLKYAKLEPVEFDPDEQE